MRAADLWRPFRRGKCVFQARSSSASLPIGSIDTDLYTRGYGHRTLAKHYSVYINYRFQQLV